MNEYLPWLAGYAAQSGLRYEELADERWMRAWEPFVTLRTPLHYAHALQGTGAGGSLTIGRIAVEAPYVDVRTGQKALVWSFVAIVQDERLLGRAAVAADPGSVFAEPGNEIPVPRMATGDPHFDHVFASYAKSAEELAATVTPSLRKLLGSWRTAVHLDLRPGGFVLAPVALAATPESISWRLSAVSYVGEKATKRG